MKKIAVILIGIIAFACSKNDKESNSANTLVGRWQLQEVLADPGDGSGVFHAVSSNKVLQFTANGMVTSNGDICSMSTDSNAPSSATYSIANSLINANCGDFNFEITGGDLIIDYPCIEPCKVKYVKVKAP